MNSPRFLQQVIGLILIIVFLAGCATPTPILSPTLPQPPTGQLPPTSAQPVPPTGQPSLFKLVKSVQVTPDEHVLDGGFIRLGYVPALDRIVAVFKANKLAIPEGGCIDGAHLYRIYTIDLQPDGETHVLNCEPGFGDSTELFVGDILYDVGPAKSAPRIGWHITKYDAVTWKVLAEIDYPLNDLRAQGIDESIMLVNGMLDVSSIYTPPEGDPSVSLATHHHFFTLDLQFLESRILTDTPHIEGSSTIFVDGKYYFITADDMKGNVIVMTYDEDWKYLGKKMLRENGIWSEGVAFDGQRFYVVYMDTSQNLGTDWIPLYANIHLAAFDRDWNLLEDLAVTNYPTADEVETWRPYVFLHGNRLYVSYDVTPHDPVTGKDLMSQSQAYITMYYLNGMP